MLVRLAWEVFHVLADLVTDAAEESEALLFSTIQCGGILEIAMNGDRAAWKDWAGFLGVVAHRQYVVEPLACEVIHVLRAMAGNVDPDLAHYRDGFGANLARPRAGALHFEAVAGVVTQQALRHLAAGGVASAKNEDSLLSGHMVGVERANERAP
jgi:hypothetical protein